VPAGAARTRAAAIGNPTDGFNQHTERAVPAKTGCCLVQWSRLVDHERSSSVLMLPTNRASSIGEQVMRKTRGSDRPRQRIASRSASRAITPPAAVIASQSRWKTVLGSGAISFSAAAKSGGLAKVVWLKPPAPG
jgi:hypothetical protein